MMGKIRSKKGDRNNYRPIRCTSSTNFLQNIITTRLTPKMES